MHFIDFSTSIVAGDKVAATLTVNDQFDNVCSAGVINQNLPTVEFTASCANNSQLSMDDALCVHSSLSEPDRKIQYYTFSLADHGRKEFPHDNGLIALKKAGSQWIKAYDVINPTINTEVSPNSVRPVIQVLAGPAGMTSSATRSACPSRSSSRRSRS